MFKFKTKRGRGEWVQQIAFEAAQEDERLSTLRGCSLDIEFFIISKLQKIGGGDVSRSNFNSLVSDVQTSMKYYRKIKAGV